MSAVCERLRNQNYAALKTESAGVVIGASRICAGPSQQNIRGFRNVQAIMRTKNNRTAVKTITRGQSARSVGLIAMAGMHRRAIDDLLASALEITGETSGGEPDDIGHTADGIDPAKNPEQGAKRLLWLLKIKVWGKRV